MKKTLGRILGKSNGSNEHDTTTPDNEAAVANRQVELDTLEPRVLFSGAPVESPEQPDAPAQVENSSDSNGSAETQSAEQQGLVANETGLDQNAQVALVGADDLTTQLNEQTLAAIAEVAAQRW
ncbi:MAG: LEPR-XLL domain-containing protein, partial [Verrucomicrobiales bacterium]|nr:LEPR-XLL domain-containing protein [Verrucomicrobiales bacterium]